MTKLLKKKKGNGGKIDRRQALSKLVCPVRILVRGTDGKMERRGAQCSAHRDVDACMGHESLMR